MVLHTAWLLFQDSCKSKGPQLVLQNRDQCWLNCSYSRSHNLSCRTCSSGNKPCSRTFTSAGLNGTIGTLSKVSSMFRGNTKPHSIVCRIWFYSMRPNVAFRSCAYPSYSWSSVLYFVSRMYELLWRLEVCFSRRWGVVACDCTGFSMFSDAIVVLNPNLHRTLRRKTGCTYWEK